MDSGRLLQFIADRMEFVYKENPNVDFMIALRSLVSEQFDETSNPPDERPSGTGIPVPGKWVDGIPSAGVICELLAGNSNKWEQVVVDYISATHLICTTKKSQIHLAVAICEFRPIETPAQAEEKKRNKFKSELAKLLAKHRVAIIARHVEKNNIKTAHIGFEYSGQDQIMTRRSHLAGYEIDGLQVDDQPKDKSDV